RFGRVTGISSEQKTIQFSDGDASHFDKLLIATGGAPVNLDVPGVNLPNVFALRNRADADRILSAAKSARRIVVIGSSFIGMEVAASLRHRGLAVTVVSKGAVPFEKTLGREIGGVFAALHQENGVRFRFGANVAQIISKQRQGGRVGGVVLKTG